MRRNDIVEWTKPNGSPYSFYGRICRIEGDKALWFCTGKHIHLTPLRELVLSDYKGRMEWTGESGSMVVYYEKDNDCNFVYVDEPDEDGTQWVRKVKFVRPVRFFRMPTLRQLKRMAARYAGRSAWKTPLDYEFLNK